MESLRARPVVDPSSKLRARRSPKAHPRRRESTLKTAREPDTRGDQGLNRNSKGSNDSYMALTIKHLLLVPIALTLYFASNTCAFADSAPFDLAGPKVDVRVERAGKTLPIASVPNLVAGGPPLGPPCFSRAPV